MYCKRTLFHSDIKQNSFEISEMWQNGKPIFNTGVGAIYKDMCVFCYQVQGCLCLSWCQNYLQRVVTKWCTELLLSRAENDAPATLLVCLGVRDCFDVFYCRSRRNFLFNLLLLLEWQMETHPLFVVWKGGG